MRYGPAEQLIGLMLELGAAHAGLGVADIMERFGVSRRTAERMLTAVGRLLPLEELDACGGPPQAVASACLRSSPRLRSMSLPPSNSRRPAST
ncbi:MAG TPA: hypothetical protein VHK26_02465, partial [Methyloceanibacter sp.]|nr:hypothetical protein [Methyloceanibacter sp.]